MNNDLFNEAGFLKDPNDWDEVLMFEIANREGIKMSSEMVDMVRSCREYYTENQTVPPLREFSKMHGGDRKGTHLNALFSGGPLK